MKLIGLFLLVEASVTGAQSLLEATASDSQFSEFHDLLAASGLMSTSSSGSEQQTILVPNNDAFDNYRRATGRNFGSLSSPDLEDTLNYHSLQGALSSADIQNPRGLLSNTALKNPDRDNRGLDSNGAKKSQVVHISPEGEANGSRIKVRDAGGVNVKSGKGQEIVLDPAPGKWSGGIFYMVDGFLTLPVNQTDTMAAQGLTSFVAGLERYNISRGTNAAPNLTSVCPINEAFTNISRSCRNLTSGPGSLLATLTRHGLPDTYYTTNFTDGDLIYSQNGYPILVTRRNGSIFLNDAKLVGTDFIASSGAVHALDRIMGFLNTTTNITTPANADIYRYPSNIPNPPPESSSPSTSTSPPTAIPTPLWFISAGNSPVMRWKSQPQPLILGFFMVEAWKYLILE
ncbi:hypothetical protein MMC29_003494 [Sticta canariensis]|nr:hypothetical protein [Sticta canariensis]